jgi:hypothetical protein
VDADPTLAPALSTTSTGATTTVTDPGPAGAAVTAPTETATSPATTATSPPAGATTTTAPGTTSTATSTVPARLIAPAAYGCPSGDPSGLAAEDAFLAAWVPRILGSAAYRDDGVLIIAFTGAGGRARADTGALVLSRWTPRGKRISTSYGAYSLLRSIEDMLDLAPLANAATAPSFARLVLR